MAAGQALTVFRFHDARGTEGDTGDARRVGGVYGGYGNRLAKVVTSFSPGDTPPAEWLRPGAIWLRVSGTDQPPSS